jgi:trans-aconitate methyltransferase
MIDTKRAKSFTQNAERYDRIRPGYPAAMYGDMARYIPKSGGVSFLEIGAGNGVATGEVYERWASPITAIEPGVELYQILQRKFAHNPAMELYNGTFEEFSWEKRYDCIFSATAFHWIEPELRYTKTARLLNDDGILALFWNNYSRSDDEIFDNIQDVYATYHPDVDEGVDIRELQREKIAARAAELENAVEFTQRFHGEYRYVKPFTAEEYIQLLQTFSPNAIKPAGELTMFYQQMKALILENGNELLLPILVNLEVGRVV